MTVTTTDRGAWTLDGYELVCGLEVHVELTELRTKMFSPEPIAFGGDPNTRVGPVSAGLPGSLPVANAAAVESAARLGLALNCGIADRCHFHRKNYFYPDLPKNYQISQYDVPLCHEGWLEIEVDGETVRIGIERVHMEEDTAKSSHEGGAGRLHGADRSLIDLNRAGIPLLECVSQPDVRRPEEAQAYVRELIAIARALAISDARMEEGSIRCDANVSVRRPGEAYGTRTEIKNLNSVRSVGRAIVFEAERQVRLLQDGGEVVQETRHWDEDRGVTETLRRKETLADYRYFPDPDLAPMVHSVERVEQLRATLPELPAAARARVVAMGPAPAQAATIVGGGMLAWFDDAVAAGADPATAGNWLSGEIVGQLSAAGLEPDDSGLTGQHVAELAGLIADGTLSNKLAKQVLEVMVEQRGALQPREIAEQHGLRQVSDEGELRAIVEQIVADNPDVVEKIRGGADKAIGALVGKVMQATQGQADPALTNQLLRELIS